MSVMTPTAAWGEGLWVSGEHDRMPAPRPWERRVFVAIRDDPPRQPPPRRPLRVRDVLCYLAIQALMGATFAVTAVLGIAAVLAVMYACTRVG